ncbi:uncharacterized protein LOC144179539 isoform X2 [Haemaphysalis longicornis]
MTTVGAERPLPPLHLCALGGGWSEVRRLLATGEAQLEAPDPKGRTALFLCAMLGDLPGAQLLLRAGARADHADHAGQTPLHLVAHKGHKGLVRLLLSSSGGVPWARGDARGRTPLHLAAASSSPAQARAAVLAALLERADPGQVDLQDDHKQTALHKSALACHLESMAALLRKGANALLQDAEGRTPLHLCAASTRPTALACVRLLLECEASLVGWQDYRGCTPLHLAVASGTLPVIDLLTSWSECEVNALDDLFRTPLHWAAILGRREVVQLLLDRRADPSLADRTGATPLGHACCGPPTGESEALVTMLLSRHSAAPLHAALMGATLAGNAVAVRALLRRGVALDATGAAAVVRAAASQGHLAVLQLLLDLRGVREAERQSGATRQTALMVAACGGHTPCLLALLDAAGTPSLHCTDSGGRTALHWAVVGDQACVCRLLVQRGCPVDAPDHQGRTALHYASSRGSSACVMVLLEVRADPNLTDTQGDCFGRGVQQRQWGAERVAACCGGPVCGGRAPSSCPGHPEEVPSMAEEEEVGCQQDLHFSWQPLGGADHGEDGSGGSGHPVGLAQAQDEKSCGLGRCR